jgi:hypothetical protein
MDVTTSTTSSDSAIPPNLAIAGTTKARCPACGTEVTWSSPEDAVGTCPKCTAPLVVVAATGSTIAEAIELAEQQLPEAVERSPRQPSLPGLAGIDAEAALKMLFEIDDEIDRQTTKVERRKSDYDTERKTLTALQEKRSAASRQFRDRIQDADPSRPKAPCEWERDHGRPCPICRAPNALPLTHAGVLDRAIDLAQKPGSVYPCATDLRTLLAVYGRVHLLPEEVERIPTGPAILDLLVWCRDVTQPRPTLLGTPHVIGDVAGQCADCGAISHELAVTFGYPDGWPVGTLVGTDCPGKPVEEDEPEPARRIPKRHKAKASAAVGGQTGGARGKKAPARKGRR